MPDDQPEEAEVYVVTLLPPEGGADLGPVYTRVVIIERNDAPYGMVEILPLDSRLVIHTDIILIKIHVYAHISSSGFLYCNITHQIDLLLQ